MARKYPIPVSAGGALRTQPNVSLENVGDGNYSAKVNLRRDGDQEIRREGWVKFFPETGQPINQQYIWDGALTLVRLAELVRGDGTRVIVGASATTIKYFNPATAAWVTIGTGFSAQGKRWQVEAIGGYLVMNNTVDLPIVYTVGAAAVTPIYELRDVGVSAVGRISQINGFLMCMNISFIDDNQLNAWMKGYPNFAPTGTINEAASFTATLANSTKQFNVTTGAANVVATLPALQPPPTWWILVQKVDAGAGVVTTLPVLADQKITLAAVNDSALIWSDGSNYFAKFFAGGVQPAYAPYGIPPANIVENIPYRVTWSTPGNPTNWAPIYTAYMAASSANIPLPFATPVLKVGDLVAVLGGGPNGGTLGGDSNFPDGIPITAINGNVITIAEATDAGLNYPLNVRVVRFADIGSLVGFYDLQGDGSPIIGAEPLQGRLIIYKDGSLFIGTYIAIAGSPFSFNEKYIGYNAPLFGDAIISLNGQYHLFPGYGNRFYVFDGITYPQIHTPTDDARNLFFEGINNATPVWAIDNPLTKELWFCQPGLVFAFDYLKNTVSEIDAEIDAAVFCQRPSSFDKWMVLGAGGNAYTYGLSQGLVPIVTWLRDGQPAVPVLQSGLITGGSSATGAGWTDEKLLIEYTPILSSPSPDMEMTVQIATTYNPSGDLSNQMTPPADLPDPAGNNYLPAAFQAIYFQDTITVTDARDMDFRLSGRILRFQDINGGSVTRTSN